ncbi:MAG TPA: GAF domain-containing protein [Anaerolineae bacterium]|nr:GAF domain-containing protein [Anaerolineae bacterium]HQK12558.1 GAF domain-containing protein [Anaerolineae bacterium]
MQFAEVKACLDAQTLETLPRAAVASGLYYLIGIAYYFLAQAQTRVPFSIGLLVVSALLSFAMLVALSTWTLSPRNAPAAMAALLVLALLNCLHPLYAAGDPRATFLLLLLSAGTGLLLLDTFWFVVLMGLIIAGWLAAPRGFTTPVNSLNAGLGIVLTVSVAAAIHIVYRAACIQTVRLNLQYQAQQAASRRHHTHLEAGRAVATRLNASTDLDSTLQHVTEIIGSHYQCTYVGLFLMDEKSGELVSCAGTGSAGHAATQAGARVKVGRGIIGWVAQNRRMAYATDTTRDPRFVLWDLLPDTRAELTLPLQVGEHLLGVLDIQSNQPNAFHEEDVTALHLLADHIALAIQNLLLRQKEKERYQLLETLHHVGRALARPMETQAVLDMILQQLAHVIAYDRASIMLQNDTLLELAATRGFPGHKTVFQWRVPIRAGDVYDEIRRTQRPLVLDDALRRADWFHLKDLLPARSWVGIPLIHEDKVIGMLSLARQTYAPFTEEEVNFAAVFAWQATIALENARLNVELAQAQRKSEALEKTED